MRHFSLTAVLLLALAAPAAARAQQGATADRSTQLEARRAARLQSLAGRRLLLAERAALQWRDGHQDAWGYGPGAVGPFVGTGWSGTGGWESWGGSGWGGWGGWGWSPFRAYPTPNPYQDWAGLWGQGWLSEAAVPPYHRFQYRFFPETLPDPTVGGYLPVPQYVTPAPQVAPPPHGRGRAGCARVDLELADGDPASVLVPLPALGALTPEAFGAVVRERLRSGAGVVVRDLDGYVFHFPSPDRIRRLELGGC